VAGGATRATACLALTTTLPSRSVATAVTQPPRTAREHPALLQPRTHMATVDVWTAAELELAHSLVNILHQSAHMSGTAFAPQNDPHTFARPQTRSEYNSRFLTLHGRCCRPFRRCWQEATTFTIQIQGVRAH
jgi:hypothetical protein